MSEELVHFHLEHKVVRRLLGRFVSQGFVHNDLSRACLAQSRDAIPRVVLLGRLSLYGEGGARLHEEIVPLTARWTDPEDRKGPLTPYGRTAETKTVDLLESAMREKSSSVPSKVATRLQESAPRDVEELLSHLEARAEDYASDAEVALKARAEKEANEMEKILKEQQKRIEETASEYGKGAEGRLFHVAAFTVEERRQLDANRRYWQRRLEALEKEIITEPERIAHNYDVKAKRVEPIGLVYLWPTTN